MEYSSTNLELDQSSFFVKLVAAWRLRVSMAGLNLSDVATPSVEDLRSWANDEELARKHLKSIVAAIESDQEELASWATEALENMGPPLASDINWLGAVASNGSDDVVYWAATLLGRCEEAIDSVQDSLTSIVVSSKSTLSCRRRALAALSKVHTKNDATKQAIHSALNSGDSQLVSLANEILKSV
jgi:hypothetical protein